MPEISVIIPVYNVEKKIRKCLDSLLCQNFSDFELVLVNDGSHDLSGNICDEYAIKDPRIKVIHQKNSGVSVARNTGITNATGKYITFVDSDDYVESDYLQVLYQGMQNDCKLTICGIYFCSDGSDERFVQKCYDDFVVNLNKNNTEYVSDLLVNRRLNYVYGKMYRKDIIDENHIMFRKEITLGEDTIFVMDYLRHIDKVCILGNAYYNYVKYAEGTLTSRFYNNLFERYLLINKYIAELFSEKEMLDSFAVNAIDLRVLYAALWSIASIRQQKEVRLKEKLQMLDKILHAPELVDALKRNRELDQQYPEMKVMRKHAPILLLMYYLKTEVIQRQIKIIVVKVVPKSWIKRGKRWVSNVQSLFRRIMRKNV